MSEMQFTITDSDFDNPDPFAEDIPPVFEMPKAKAGRQNAVDKLITNIEEFYMFIGSTMLVHPKTAADGMIIIQNATGVAESWRDPINRNPKIKRMWEKIFLTSGYSGLIMAHIPLVLGIAGNHGAKLPNLFGKKEKEPTNDN